MTIEQFKEYLVSQGLFEREVDEIISNLNKTLFDSEIIKCHDEKSIKNVYKVKYIINADTCTYCESSDRVIIWDD